MVNWQYYYICFVLFFIVSWPQSGYYALDTFICLHIQRLYRFGILFLQKKTISTKAFLFKQKPNSMEYMSLSGLSCNWGRFKLMFIRIHKYIRPLSAGNGLRLLLWRRRLGRSRILVSRRELVEAGEWAPIFSSLYWPPSIYVRMVNWTTRQIVANFV